MTQSPASGASRPRPLSPHLSIYRPQITSVLSIMHRATGVANAGGAMLLALWLWAAAYDVLLFQTLSDFFGGIFGIVLLMGWSFSLFYHLSNGIRHLFWDAGYGYELQTVTRSGILVLISASLLTVFTWYCALM